MARHAPRFTVAFVVALLLGAPASLAQVAAKGIADPGQINFNDFETKFSRALHNTGVDPGTSGLGPIDRNALSAAIQSIALSGTNSLLVDAMIFSIDVKGTIVTLGRFRSTCNPALFADEVAPKLGAKRTAQGTFSALDALHLIPEWICTQPVYAANRPMVIGADGQASVQ